MRGSSKENVAKREKICVLCLKRQSFTKNNVLKNCSPLIALKIEAQQETHEVTKTPSDLRHQGEWGARHVLNAQKKTPRRPVSGALLCRGTWSYYFRSSPGTTPSLSRHYAKGRLGLPLPVSAIIICRGLNAILPFATCLPSYHWPQQLICRQRSPLFGTLELFLQLVSRSTSSALGIGPFPIPLKFSF